MQTGSEAQSSHDGKLVNKKRTGGKTDSPRSEIKEGKTQRGAKSKVTKNDQSKVDKHRENNEDQQEVLTCEICAVDFTEDDDKLMSCDRCMKWNCAECLGMSEAVYSFFVASGNGSHWYCKDCEGQAMRAVKVDRTIEEECSKYLEGVTNRIDSVEKKLEEKADLSVVKVLQESMETLKDQVKQLESGDTASVNGPMEKQIAEAVTEYKEREKRTCNLIFHNVKESAKTDSIARRKEDIEEVIKIGKELGCEPEVKEAIRLGKRVDGRTRLLKIVVEEFKDKRMLLSKSVKLRESDSEAWKNVFITPDQTYKQRQENKELRNELYERTQKGEENLVIRYGRIQVMRQQVTNQGPKTKTTIVGEQPFRERNSSQ